MAGEFAIIMQLDLMLTIAAAAAATAIASFWSHAYIAAAATLGRARQHHC